MDNIFNSIFAGDTQSTIGAGLFFKLAFKAAKDFPEECKKTRIDIDKKISGAIENWRNGL